MAAKEPYDYLSTMSPDVDQTMTLSPQSVMQEIPIKNDVVHKGDDKSEERICRGTSGEFEFLFGLNYEQLIEADAGTWLQFYCDPLYGDGMINSFKFTHPDAHTYVVRFEEAPERNIHAANMWGLPNVRLRVLGKI